MLDRTMYLPEDHAQMFEILADLRTYAAMNGLHELAEKLDDALLLLLAEPRAAARPSAVGAAAQETV